MFALRRIHRRRRAFLPVLRQWQPVRVSLPVMPEPGTKGTARLCRVREGAVHPLPSLRRAHIHAGKMRAVRHGPDEAVPEPALRCYAVFPEYKVYSLWKNPRPAIHTRVLEQVYFIAIAAATDTSPASLRSSGCSTGCGICYKTPYRKPCSWTPPRSTNLVGSTVTRTRAGARKA